MWLKISVTGNVILVCFLAISMFPAEQEQQKHGETIKEASTREERTPRQRKPELLEQTSMKGEDIDVPHFLKQRMSLNEIEELDAQDIQSVFRKLPYMKQQIALDGVFNLVTEEGPENIMNWLHSLHGQAPELLNQALQLTLQLPKDRRPDHTQLTTWLEQWAPATPEQGAYAARSLVLTWIQEEPFRAADWYRNAEVTRTAIAEVSYTLTKIDEGRAEAWIKDLDEGPDYESGVIGLLQAGEYYPSDPATHEWIDSISDDKWKSIARDVVQRNEFARDFAEATERLETAEQWEAQHISDSYVVEELVIEE